MFAGAWVCFVSLSNAGNICYSHLVRRVKRVMFLCMLLARSQGAQQRRIIQARVTMQLLRLCVSCNPLHNSCDRGFTADRSMAAAVP
jgi:hypothetical protein